MIKGGDLSFTNDCMCDETITKNSTNTQSEQNNDTTNSNTQNSTPVTLN